LFERERERKTVPSFSSCPLCCGSIDTCLSQRPGAPCPGCVCCYALSIAHLCCSVDECFSRVVFLCCCRCCCSLAVMCCFVVVLGVLCCSVVVMLFVMLFCCGLLCCCSVVLLSLC